MITGHYMIVHYWANACKTGKAVTSSFIHVLLQLCNVWMSDSHSRPKNPFCLHGQAFSAHLPWLRTPGSQFLKLSLNFKSYYGILAEISVPPLRPTSHLQFQLSVIHSFKYFSLPEPPPRGNANLVYGGVHVCIFFKTAHSKLHKKYYK